MIFLERERNSILEPIPLRCTGLESLNSVIASEGIAKGAFEFRENLIAQMKQSSTLNTVYVTQREFATASPNHAHVIGTDEMTTCMAVAIRNPDNGRTSVGHVDSADCINNGIRNMVESLLLTSNSVVDVHLVGCFDDFEGDENPFLLNYSRKLSFLANKDSDINVSGHSWPVALEVFKSLTDSPVKFLIKTCCILQHNTEISSSKGVKCPIVRGIAVNVIDGKVFPARFSREVKEPDFVVRSICAMEMSSLKTLLQFYHTDKDCFHVEPCRFRNISSYAKAMLNLSDEQLLKYSSTSPDVESGVFVAEARERLLFFVQHCDWKTTFPGMLPRTFLRAQNGAWKRASSL